MFIKVVFRFFFLGGKQLLMFFGYITVKVMGKKLITVEVHLKRLRQTSDLLVILLLDEPSKNKI